jgi:hypothetical protein
MGPVAVFKLSALHHLALVVDGFAKGEKISRQSVEAYDCCWVRPKSGIGGKAAAGSWSRCLAPERT